MTCEQLSDPLNADLRSGSRVYYVFALVLTSRYGP